MWHLILWKFKCILIRTCILCHASFTCGKWDLYISSFAISTICESWLREQKPPKIVFVTFFQSHSAFFLHGLIFAMVWLFISSLYISRLTYIISCKKINRGRNQFCKSNLCKRFILNFCWTMYGSCTWRDKLLENGNKMDCNYLIWR